MGCAKCSNSAESFIESCRLFYSIIPFGFVHILLHIPFNSSWISLSNQIKPPCNVSSDNSFHFESVSINFDEASGA